MPTLEMYDAQSQALPPEDVVIEVRRPKRPLRSYGGEYNEELMDMSEKEFYNVMLEMTEEERNSIMKNEAARLKSYEYLWPEANAVKYPELAREGFYYTGVSDRVRCPFCNGSLGNWEMGDKVRESHRSFFKACPLAKSEDRGIECGNIPMTYVQSRPPTPIPEGPFNYNPIRLDARKECPAEADSYSTQAHSVALDTFSDKPEVKTPSSPFYSDYKSRLSSYKSYPESSYPMTAKMLCDAGFYYEGPGDKVRCYWCDGALECWEDSDEPWRDHARWYPGCKYVQDTKGKQFIKNARADMTSDELATAATMQYNSCGIAFLHNDVNYDDDPKKPAASGSSSSKKNYDGMVFTPDIAVAAPSLLATVPLLTEVLKSMKTAEYQSSACHSALVTPPDSDDECGLSVEARDSSSDEEKSAGDEELPSAMSEIARLMLRLPKCLVCKDEVIPKGTVSRACRHLLSMCGPCFTAKNITPYCSKCSDYVQIEDVHCFSTS